MTYHSLHCRGMAVNQETGEIGYSFSSVYGPVAQFIAPKPISQDFDTFSIEIVKQGMRGCIGIGLCHRRYSEDRQPGWDSNSIGYHADDGGIYTEYGLPGHVFGRVVVGEVMECAFDFANRTVTFLRNGNHVFTSDQLVIPPGGFYPIVGLHSPGEIIKLLEVDPWTPDSEDVIDSSKIFHTLHCREARISQVSGITRYRSTDALVGQIISKVPLSSECPKFSVEIVSVGEKGGISVGVCHRLYPTNCQPGWLPGSIAYSTDGRIYKGDERDKVTRVPKHRVSDVITCQLEASNSIAFLRNGRLIFRSTSMALPSEGFHAIVGFQSHGDIVCLLEKEPWRTDAALLQKVNDPSGESSPAATPKSEFDSSQLVETEPHRSQETPQNPDTMQKEPVTEHTRPRCCICMDRGVSRFLIPCGHTFCEECTEEWTLHHKTCPACRVPYQGVNMLYF